MEMLKKVTRRKQKAAEASVDETPQPSAPEMLEMSKALPITVYSEPSAEQAKRMLEKEQEDIAMDTFRQRISSYRNSQARYRNPMAPGFDYANWKPYGKVRYRNQEAEFHRMAQGLAPYVACLVESACQGVEERRWAAMTQMHPEEAAAMESIQASRIVSRAASRDRLAV